VRVTENSAGQLPGVVTSEDEGFTVGSQASVALAEPKLGVPGHSTVGAGFGQVRLGAVLSVTEMVRLQVVELLQSSVAVHVRVTENSAGQLPGVVTLLLVTSTLISQASVAVALPKLGEPGHSTVGAGLGQVIEGAVLSVTEIVLLQVVELPQSSVAVHVRVTVNGQLPEVVTSENPGITVGSQASVAVAVPKIIGFGHSTLDTEGQVMVGAVLSVTEMVRLQVEELPQSSVAVQVRVTENSAGQLPGVVTSEDVGFTVGSQASVAVALPKLGEPGHSTVGDGFGHVIEGAVLSVTEMVRLHVEELPQSSVAVQVRVTENSAGQLPGVVTSDGTGVTVGSQASEAVAEPKLGEPGHSTVGDGLGHVIFGAVLSVTEIVRLQVEELPQSSVAVHVRVTENSAGQLPGVVTSEEVGSTVGSQASVAVAEPKFGELGHSTFDTEGQVMLGAVLSVTETVRLQVAVLVQLSVAVQVRVTEYSAAQVPGVVTSSAVIPTEVSQLSVALAEPKLGVFGHSTDVVGLGHVITGGTWSTTLIILQHTTWPSSQVMVSQIENCTLHKPPAKTLIDEPVVEPTIVPAPVIDQW
jgi:hypothetical protein